MNTILDLIDTVARLYAWIIIAYIILSFLMQFGIVDQRNQIVRQIWDFLYRLTEPVFKRVRPYMPDLGGFDLTPIPILLALSFGPRLLKEIFGYGPVGF